MTNNWLFLPVLPSETTQGGATTTALSALWSCGWPGGLAGESTESTSSRGAPYLCVKCTFDFIFNLRAPIGQLTVPVPPCWRAGADCCNVSWVSQFAGSGGKNPLHLLQPTHLVRMRPESEVSNRCGLVKWLSPNKGTRTRLSLSCSTQERGTVTGNCPGEAWIPSTPTGGRSTTPAHDRGRGRREREIEREREGVTVCCPRSYSVGKHVFFRKMCSDLNVGIFSVSLCVYR